MIKILNYYIIVSKDESFGPFKIVALDIMAGKLDSIYRELYKAWALEKSVA